jgi:hypothetical protein
VTSPTDQVSWFGAALEGLESFLLSDDVFRRLGSAPLQPQQDLSLGALLLTADSLAAANIPLSPDDRGRADRLLLRWDEEQARRPAALERKALRELPQRLNLWRAYLTDLAENPREARSFSTDVRNRVLLSRLLPVLSDRSETETWEQRAAALDAALRPIWHPGAFVWDDYLTPAYPREEYWFLYGGPAAAS